MLHGMVGQTTRMGKKIICIKAMIFSSNLAPSIQHYFMFTSLYIKTFNPQQYHYRDSVIQKPLCSSQVIINIREIGTPRKEHDLN